MIPQNYKTYVYILWVQERWEVLYNNNNNNNNSNSAKDKSVLSSEPIIESITYEILRKLEARSQPIKRRHNFENGDS